MVEGNFRRKWIDRDGNCHFSAFEVALGRQAPTKLKMRQFCIDVILQNEVYYNEALLGKSRDAYLAELY